MKRKAKKYNPLDHSVVQAAMTNQRVETYEATDFHEALLFAIAREIGRVHWNRYQTSWSRWSDDPHIPGIQWRNYSFDCGCPEDPDGFIPSHDENCRDLSPNFGFEDVRFVWYKNPGRGMSVNKDWTASKWEEWFDRCIAKIREFDSLSGVIGFVEIPIPGSGDFYSAQCRIGFVKAANERKSWLGKLRAAVEEADKRLRTNWRTNKPEEQPEFRKFIVGDAAIQAEIVEAIALGVYAERQRASSEDRPVARKRQS